jgi:hypothetical protein
MPQISHAQLPTPISIINESTILTDADIAPVVVALQQQVTSDFRPVWGTDAELKMIPSGTQPPTGTWWLVILDDSDQAGALGYHDLTPDGLPIGKVFAGSDLKAGMSWSVTASHELLEMLADPNINLTVFVQNANTTGTLYAYEVCDACEDDSFGYRINNVLVSDFVYPAWFETFQPQGTQLDRMNQIQTPLQLLPGGYIGTFSVTDGSGWQQQTEQKHPTNLRHRGHVGSRRERRSIPRTQWLPSLAQRKITNNAQQYRLHLQEIIRRKEAA